MDNSPVPSSVIPKDGGSAGTVSAPVVSSPTPGIYTSEFWLTLLVHAFAGITIVAGLTMTGNKWVDGIITSAGALVALINQLGYTNSRTTIKTNF